MGFPQAKSPMCLVERVDDGTKLIFIQEVLHNLACPSQISTALTKNRTGNVISYTQVSQIGPDEIHVRRCHLPNPLLATPHSANSSVATSTKSKGFYSKNHAMNLTSEQVASMCLTRCHMSMSNGQVGSLFLQVGAAP